MDEEKMEKTGERERKKRKEDAVFRFNLRVFIKE